MKLEYSLLVLALGLVYGVVKNYFPDFPLDENTVLTFALYVLLKLGVEVAGAPLRNWCASFK
jgi:hypothetical protein